MNRYVLVVLVSSTHCAVSGSQSVLAENFIIVCFSIKKADIAKLMYRLQMEFILMNVTLILHNPLQVYACTGFDYGKSFISCLHFVGSSNSFSNSWSRSRFFLLWKKLCI